MAQVITTLCDIHMNREPREDIPGAPHEFATRLPGGQFHYVTVDLCDQCAKPVTDALAELAEIGRPFNPGGIPAPVAKPTNGKRLTCPVCGGSYQNRGSLAGHLRDKHSVSISEAMPVRGTRPLMKTPCPECDFVASNRQGLAAHARAAHGLGGAELSSRLDAARDE